MPNLTIAAIILRFSNYRDNDRMLTLLSPNMGRIDVLSRGCRKPRSPLLAASEWFATGEYVLFQNKDRYILTACTVHDSFYPIRFNYDKLNFAAFLTNLCEIAAQPNEPCEALFSILVKALNHITYREPNLHALSAAFMYCYIRLLGYKPCLDHCVKCEEPLNPNEPIFFDCEDGGIVCQCCKSHQANTTTHAQLNWLKNIDISGFEYYETLTAQDAPYTLMLHYVTKKVDRPIKSVHLPNP